jgi:hypothetical protein
MADDAHTDHAAPAAAHDQFHLPPNSWAPISVAVSLTMCFVGTLSATWVWVIGLIWLIASLTAWFRGARNEFRELPESSGEH